MSDARELSEMIGKMVHGCPARDVMRALTTVMSCRICVKAENEEAMLDLLETVVWLLRNQVVADFPKIKAMMAKGEVNHFILPMQRM